MKEIKTILFICSLLIVSACGKTETNDLESMKAALEEAGYTVTYNNSEIETDASEVKYKDIDYIKLMKNFDIRGANTGGYDGSYSISAKGTTATFYYTPSKDEALQQVSKTADFDISEFEKIRDLLYPIEEYVYNIDENGKVIYENDDYALCISFTNEEGKPDMLYTNKISNLDKILKEFEKLKENSDVAY